MSILGYVALFHAVMIAVLHPRSSESPPDSTRLAPGMLAVSLLLLLSGSVLCRRFPPPTIAHPGRHQLRAWHRALGLPSEPRPWHIHQSDHLLNLMDWLDQVPQAQGFDDEGIRQTIWANVREILAAIDTHEAIREVLFRLIEQRPPFGRNVFRFAQLMRILSARAETLNESPGSITSIDTLIAAIQNSERDSTDRPTDSNNSQVLEEIRGQVLHGERQPLAWHALALFDDQCARLISNPPAPLPDLIKNPLALFLASECRAWREQPEALSSPDMAEFKAFVMDYQNGLENTPNEARAFNEQAYLVSSREAMFLYNHGWAYRAALLELIPYQPPTSAKRSLRRRHAGRGAPVVVQFIQQHPQMTNGYRKGNPAGVG